LIGTLHQLETVVTCKSDTVLDRNCSTSRRSRVALLRAGPTLDEDLSKAPHLFASFHLIISRVSSLRENLPVLGSESGPSEALFSETIVDSAVMVMK
jgi:hypothetical protein